MQSPPCPICESLENKVTFCGTIRGVKALSPRRILKCRNCSHLFVNPIPSSSEIAAHHSQSKRIPVKDLETVNKKIKKWSRGWRKFILKEYLGYKKASSVNVLKYISALFLSRFTRLEPLQFQGHGRILDVGCNTGLYLYFLRNLGWNTWGVELDHNACLAAKEVGIKVFCGKLEDISFSSSFFDVIRFHNVLEHMPYPKQALKKARQLLKKGGRIYISIPNTRSLAAFLSKESWLILGHIQGFSPRSMARLCRDLDLKIKSVRFISSRDRILKAIAYFFKLESSNSFLKNKCIQYLFAPPLRFLLNITHLGDTFILDLAK